MTPLRILCIGPAGSFLSIAALFWAFTQAPLLHIHPFEEDHPSASVVHQARLSRRFQASANSLNELDTALARPMMLSALFVPSLSAEGKVPV